MRYLLASLLIIGCTLPVEKPHAVPHPARTLHPSVVISDDFTMDEKVELLKGLHAWETAVPEIKFSYGEGPETIRIYKAECPLNNGEHPAGEQIWQSRYVSLICIDGDYLHANGSRFKATVQHELGHVFKLQHITDVSIMQPEYSDIPDDIQPRDIEALREIWAIKKAGPP